MRTYLHLTTTSGKHETRLFKEADVALRSGLFEAVGVIAKKGRGDDALPLREEVAPRIQIQRIPVRHRLGSGLAHCLWLIEAFARSVAVRPSVLSIHHVILLPLGVALKLVTGAKLVYDAHELETESASLVGRPRRKALLKRLERTLIGFCDQTVVVGEGIADWYRAAYPGIPITVVHNYPKRQPLHPSNGDLLRRTLQIPADRTVFIYQGVLEADRGIPLLLETFIGGLVPRGVFVAMGYGSMESVVRRAAEISPYVAFQAAVAPTEILDWTRSADFGVCVFDAPCLSYAYCAPNKVFEYLQAGLPMIVASPLLEMSRLVRERGLGQIVELNSVSIAAVLNAVISSGPRTFADAVHRAGQDFVWENEEPQLLEVYRRLVGSALPAVH